MRNQKDVHHAHSKSSKVYIVTLDLPEKMLAFAKKGLLIPKEPFLNKIQQNLVTRLQEILPQYRVEAVQCRDMYHKITASVHELTKKNDMLVVSSVPELVEKFGGVHLQINRIVNCEGNLLGIGPRPGYSPIEQQIREIIFHAEQWPLILVEDGSFTGGTICTVLETCRSRDIKLNYLVIGLLFDEARNAIEQTRGGMKIQAVYQWEKDGFIDWLPDYDFFPFIPNAGRVVGHVYNGTIMPTYLHNGLSLSMPYILPYGRPVGWASLPNNLRIVSAFSLDCIHDTISIFEEMESLNHKKITLDDLIGTYPRASLAVTPKTHVFYEVEERILDLLHDDAHMLS